MSLGAVDQPSRGLLGRLQALLFPSRCPGCGLRGVLLCGDCARRLPWLGPDVCPRCAEPRRSGWICGRCRAGSAPLDGVRAACRFEGLARQSVHDLKYRGARVRAPLLAELLEQALAARPIRFDVLVPVPLSPERRRQRGFNQAELVARALGERIGVPVDPDALARVRDTPRQVGRTGQAREQNVADAFACPSPEAVRGRRVGVLDDVMTTGATLRACATALRTAGAERVYGLVVAREV